VNVQPSDATVEAEVAIATLTGEWHAPGYSKSGTFKWCGKAIGFIIMHRAATIGALLTLYEGTRLAAQKSCVVQSIDELKQTAVAWGVRAALQGAGQP